MAKIPSFSIIPKPKETEPAWVAAVFWSLLAVLALLAIPVFVFRGQAVGLDKRSVALQEEREQLIVDNTELVQRMTLAFQRLNDFSQLLRQHLLNSNMFVFLSTICHPRVQFTSLAVSETSSHITLGMKTDNFKTLGEQLLVLKSIPQVNGPKFSGLAVDKDGKIVCTLDFDFDKKIIMPFGDL